jgi:nucleoside-diphosphate-sugar epimerase
VKVLVTGHDGYIGTVLTPLLVAAGHEPHGLDTSLFANHAFGEIPEISAREADIRDIARMVEQATGARVTLASGAGLQELVEAGELDDALRRRVPA